MLTHIDVHYLVGILTQIGSPWGVEIQLGEMVEDSTAEKPRDVDITVRYRLASGAIAEMHGIEVKDEGRPLDVVHVEQIILKLKDMPDLTNHGLVSSSGFTGPARKKARHHGLGLYNLRDWDGSGLRVDMSKMTFAGVVVPEWKSVAPRINVATPLSAAAELRMDMVITDPDNPDQKRTLGELIDQVCGIVLNRVGAEDPDILSLKPGEAKSYDVDTPVNFGTPFLVAANGSMVTVPTIQIQGVAVLKKIPMQHAFKALIRDDDDSPVAGCMLHELPDGSLFVYMTSSTEGSLTARILSVSDRGKTKIYKERMTPISPGGPVLINGSSS